MSALTFDATTHRYALGGRALVSVTQALVIEGFIVKDWYTDEARERGTLVHRACQASDTDDSFADVLDPLMTPYIDAYQQFCSDVDARWSHVELPMADAALGLAGTLDRLGTVAGDLAIVDIKTGGPQRRWHGLQTALYAVLAEACGLIPSARRVKRYGLHVTRASHQQYRLQPHNVDTDTQFVRAIAAVAVYKVAHGYAIA